MYCSLQRVAAVLQTAGLYYSRSSILTEWDHTLYTHSFAETSYWQFVCTAVHQVRTGYCLLYYTGHLQVKVKVWHQTADGQRNAFLTVWRGQIYDLCPLKITGTLPLNNKLSPDWTGAWAKVGNIHIQILNIWCLHIWIYTEYLPNINQINL